MHVCDAVEDPKLQARRRKFSSDSESRGWAPGPLPHARAMESWQDAP
jgi:hypothetical protein